MRFPPLISRLRFLPLGILLFLSPQARGQDQNLDKTGGCQGSFYCGPNTPLQGVPWASFTQNYLLTPRNPDQSICIFVANNDSSTHNFTLAVSQTGDTNISSFSNQSGRWIGDTVVGVNPPSVAANSTASFYVHSNAAAKIAFQFGGASGTGTADIFLVQTNALSCGPALPSTGQNSTLSTPNTGTSAAPPVMAVSDGLAQAFFASNQGVITNPASGQLIIAANANNGSRSLYFDKLVISASASATISVNVTSTAGGGCTGVSPVQQKLFSSVTTTAAAQTGTCTTNPGIVANFLLNGAASAGVTVIDLKGIIAQSGTTNGISVQMGAALTGTITAALTWYEK